MGVVYLLHSEPRYRHASHYLGYCSTGDVSRRIERHIAGRGAVLTRHMVRAGCELWLVATWDGDRTLERRLKQYHNAWRYCPVCRQRRGLPEHVIHARRRR